MDACNTVLASTSAAFSARLWDEASEALTAPLPFTALNRTVLTALVITLHPRLSEISAINATEKLVEASPAGSELHVMRPTLLVEMTKAVSSIPDSKSTTAD